MRFFVLMVAFVLAVCGSALGADAVPVVVEQSVSWTSVLAQSALILLQIVGPVLAVLIAAAATWALKNLAKKFNIQLSAQMDEQVTKAVGQAVAAAEEWARKQAAKPTGSQKADIALSAVRDLLDSPTYQEYGEPALQKLIDAAVLKMRAEKEEAQAIATAVSATAGGQ